MLNEARLVKDVDWELELWAAAAILVEDAAAVIFAAIEEASSDTICVEAEDAWVASIFAALLDPVNANKLALRPLASTTSPDLESDDKAFTSLELI